MNEDFKIGQLTKQLVTMKLKEMEDPCAVAASLVKKTITVALTAAPQQAKDVVADACYGGMQGLLLAERDLSSGAVKLIEAVCESAQDVSLDPTDMMRYGLTGVARIAKFAPPEVLTSIRLSLEARFTGVGDAFLEALTAEQRTQSQSSAQKV